MPFAVFGIKGNQEQTQESLDAMGRIIGEMADSIERQTKILETEHKLKMQRVRETSQ